MGRTTWIALVTAIVAGGACKGGEPGSAQASVPGVEAGKLNVAFVYVGPIGDGGWSFAHDEARRRLEADVPGVHTAYVESVPEGAAARQVIAGLARKGFDLVVATSFGFMDACEEVAREFPAVKFLHVSGFRSNGANFGNLMGAIESMKYLAGMIAGARAKDDGRPRVGYVAPFPIAEVVRLGNAVALGVRQTCPECVVEFRWINSWFDPPREKEAAESLLQAGADVVVTGADTPGPVAAAGQAGRWGIGYDSRNACRADPEHCLTAPYWNWAPAYEAVVKAIRDGTWKGGNSYLDADSGVVGLYGFMDGETVPAGVPAWVVPQVRERLDQMRRGAFTRFDVFRGPLRDNGGREVVAAGATLAQEDLEGIRGVPGRPDCTLCMDWLVEGVQGRLPGR